MQSLFSNNRADFPLRPASDSIQVRVLSSGVAETVTVPEGANYVIFATTAAFYARVGAAAAVPSGDVTDGSGSELNPVGYALAGVSSFSLISGTDCTVTMAFYS